MKLKLPFVFCSQVNVVNYKTRPTAKDFIQVEIVVEKNTQKIILIGKVSYPSTIPGIIDFEGIRRTISIW